MSIVLTLKLIIVTFLLVIFIGGRRQSGTSYIRWGRKTCTSGNKRAQLVYKGTVVYCVYWYGANIHKQLYFTFIPSIVPVT